MDALTQMKSPLDLVVVMPAYNEEACLRKVVNEWFIEIENWTEEFIFLALNDGSTDRTPDILERLRKQYGQRFVVRHEKNHGHGQTCVQGYRWALENNTPFVFQIDSDGQCDPQYFFRFWRRRFEYDVIYGNRIKRDDGWRRVAASRVLRTALLMSTGVNCIDANVPYRLMRTEGLGNMLDRIPGDFFLANVALAVLLRQADGWRHGSIPIRFRERYGGEPSVPLSKFGTKANELLAQLRTLSN